jgi:hypothetical protein
VDFGMHLRELSRLRVGVVVCLLLATFASVSISYKISLLPPGLSSRSLAMAAASTELLVDTPTSLVLDLNQDTSDIDSLTNRSVLLGNVMASPPVVLYIARRAGIPPNDIKAATPRTPNQPRPFETERNKKRSSDLLASTNQYRIDIESDPTVPILKIYAQAPSAKAAGELANASVDGLRDYLNQVAKLQRVDISQQVRVTQLGRADGKVINGGIRWQLMFMTFIVVLAISAAAAIFMARVRQGFRMADERELATPGAVLDGRPAGGPASAPADRPDLVVR